MELLVVILFGIMAAALVMALWCVEILRENRDFHAAIVAGGCK